MRFIIDAGRLVTIDSKATNGEAIRRIVVVGMDLGLTIVRRIHAHRRNIFL